MRTRSLFLFFAVSAAILSSTFFATAQTNSADAHLTGTLLDSSGAGVPGVHVTAQLESPPAAQLWKATSTTDGHYSLSIPPGRYHVVFERLSFAVRDVIVELSPNEQRELNLHLELQPLSSNVVVTAQPEPALTAQTAAPVSIIDKDEIEARQFVGLADALTFSTGVAIGRTGAEGGTASVFLNGGNSNFTKVLVDGAPINPPGAAVDFSSLTLDNIDKVEIVRGAESAIYGTDAVSGVIQLFTHRGETRVPEITVFSEGGSFASGRGGAQVSGLLDHFDYSLAASYFQTDGQGPDDDFLNRTFSGNFGYTFNDSNHVRLSLRDDNSIAGIPGQTLFEPPNLDQRYTQHLFSSSAVWDFVAGKHWHHQIAGAESYTFQANDNPTQSFFATDPNAFCPQTSPTAVPTAEFCDFTGNSHFQYNRVGVSAQSSYLLSNFAATAGYQYEVENAFLTSINVPHARRNNQAGYLDFRYRPHPRASLNFGARAEANGYFGTRVVPRAGASLVLFYGKGSRGDTLLRIFFAEGIKEPRFDQTFGDNFGDFGNPHLRPEASKTWNVGLQQKVFHDRIDLGANYFSSFFYDMVTFAFCDTTNNFCKGVLPSQTVPFGYFFNTDRARARGFNFNGRSRLTNWLNLAANYTYDDSRVLVASDPFDPTELPGNHLIRRPVNSGSLNLNAAFRRLTVTLGGYFTGVRTDSDFLGLGFTHDPGYARFDLSGSYRFGHGITLYARITNLFDKQYQDALGYPALGRDARVGVRYTFGGRN